MARPELNVQIMQAMQQYTAEVQQDIQASMMQVGEEALTRVRAKSPARTGKYRKGWKLSASSQPGIAGFAITQGGKDRAQLTHLLEYGHKTRTRKKLVAAQSHIKEVESWAVQAVQRAVQQAIEKAVKG